MELQELNPYIRYCNIHFQPSIYPQMVRAYDCRIFYVLQGCGTFYVGHDSYVFKKNSFLYIPSGAPYYFSYGKDIDIALIILNFDIVSQPSALMVDLFPIPEPADFSEDKIVPVPPCPYFTKQIFVSDFLDVKKDLLTIYDHFVNKSYLYAQQASGLLKTILMQTVSAQYAGDKTSSAQLAEEVLTYIRGHYSKSLTNQMIADQFGFHPYYLNRIVKNETGQNIHHYLIHYRLREAKMLLATSSLTIQHIAKLTGFGTPAQFSYTFKKAMGISPNQYREQNSTLI